MKAVEDRPSKARRERTVRVPQNARLVRFFLHPAGKALLVAMACLTIAGAALSFISTTYTQS